jgi:hypothetical protein
MKLSTLIGNYSVCRLNPDQTIPDWATRPGYYSVTRTGSELSIVCESENVPHDVEVESGWCGLEVEGPLDFNQVGILASLVQPLADAQIPVFVVSTYQTDYLFLKLEHLPEAIRVLAGSGHQVVAK